MVQAPFFLTTFWQPEFVHPTAARSSTSVVGMCTWPTCLRSVARHERCSASPSIRRNSLPPNAQFAGAQIYSCWSATRPRPLTNRTKRSRSPAFCTCFRPTRDGTSSWLRSSISSPNSSLEKSGVPASLGATHTQQWLLARLGPTVGTTLHFMDTADSLAALRAAGFRTAVHPPRPGDCTPTSSSLRRSRKHLRRRIAEARPPHGCTDHRAPGYPHTGQPPACARLACLRPRGAERAQAASNGREQSENPTRSDRTHPI